MTKSELIERLAGQQSHVPAKAVELSLIHI